MEYLLYPAFIEEIGGIEKFLSGWTGIERGGADEDAGVLAEGGQLLDRFVALFNKATEFEQVLGRIPGDCKFREDDQVCLMLLRLLYLVGNPGDVFGKIPYMVV